MKVKQAAIRRSKMTKKMLDLRNQIWPNLDEDMLWHRKRDDGFITIPRTMPHIMRIIDDLSPKGQPASSTYLALWVRLYDESVVTIVSETELAFEAGFSGQRAATTWAGRVAILENLGFINVVAGPKGLRQYVLILNPYIIIRKLREDDKVQDTLYTALFARAQEIGAVDPLLEVKTK
jgi:hypothetical protein